MLVEQLGHFLPFATWFSYCDAAEAMDDAPVCAGQLIRRKATLNAVARWHSRFRQGTIEVFTDREGYTTNWRPHVHTIFDEHRNEVRLVVTDKNGRHLAERTLRDPDGNEVRAMQLSLGQTLPRE